MTNRHISMFLTCAGIGVALSVGEARSQDERRPAAAPLPTLKQTAYIKASNADPYDHFACGGGNQGHRGDSIAISRDGNTMAVGAPYESSSARGIDGDQNDNSMYASGAVYVFTRQGAAWTQQAYVKASNPGQSDHFGSSIALSADGNTMAIAAYFESSAATGVNGDQTDDSLKQSGAVYVFTRTGASWSQQAYLKASNTGRAGRGEAEFGDGDQFGYSIALSGDGNTLAVGAPTEDSNAQTIDGNQTDDSATSSGAAYVFTRTGSTWSQQAYVKSSTSEAGDLFGFSVALSFDGSTLAASAFDERGSARTIDGPHDNLANGSGAVFVFTRSAGTWMQQAYIKGSKNEATDQLGYSVAISDDGNTIAAGAGDEDCLTPGINPLGCDNDSPPRGGANIWVGAAYVFVRSGGVWTEQAFIKATNPRPYNSFGVKLALSGDGSALAVTSYLEDSAGQGIKSAAIEPFLVVDHLDPWRDRQDHAEESGAVYLYARSGTTWTPQAYVKGSNTRQGHEFGSAVAVSGDGSIIAVGAHNEPSAARGIDGDQADTSAAGAGAVYVFTN